MEADVPQDAAARAALCNIFASIKKLHFASMKKLHLLYVSGALSVAGEREKKQQQQLTTGIFAPSQELLGVLFS